MGKIFNTSGKLYALINGRRKKIDYIEGMSINGDCCPKFICCGDTVAIEFKHVTTGANVQIPLTQLYDFLEAGEIIDTTPPTVPTTLAVGAIAATTIDITWVDGTDDNTVSTLVYLDGVLVATVAAGTQAYQYTGLTTATLYSLSIRSTDTAGNLSALVTDSATTA